MSSSGCFEDRNVFALKSSNRCPKEYEGGSNGGSDRAIARLVCKDRGVDYWMRKSRITVGRKSSKRSSADVDMGQSTFISRNHLEIYTTDARFYALVTGKNGVFVDDVLHKKGGSAFELPNSCLLRFPSTEIKIYFEALLPDTQNVEVKSYACHEPQPLQNPVALKSTSFGDLYSSSNHSLNVLDGGLYPVKEEIVDHVVAETLDIKKVENTSEYLAGVASNSPHQDEKEGPAKSNTMPLSSTNEHTKPPYSYAQLIVQAISSQVDRQLTLSGIYNYITKQYPYYRHGDKGWQNSIRHNLSLNRYFVKVPRAQEEAGKGCFWRIDPNSEAILTNQAFRRRRQRPVPYCKNNSFEALQPPGVNVSESSTMISTPDDSCASWEGPPSINDEGDIASSAEHFTTASEQTIRCLSSVNNFNKPSYNALPMAAVNLFASLPAGLNKPHFIFTKPLPVSTNTEQITASTAPVTSLSQNNGSFLSHEAYVYAGEGMKAASEGENKSKVQPFHIMNQPKTIILRSAPANPLNFSMPPGSQFIKLSYATQTNSTIVNKLMEEHNSNHGAVMEDSQVGSLCKVGEEVVNDVRGAISHLSSDVTVAQTV